MDYEAPRLPRTPFEDVVVTISDEEAGGHGSHWDVFFDDVNVLVKTLPRIIREAQLPPAYADVKSARPYLFPEHEPKGVLLVWPIPRFGVMAAIELDAPSGANQLISAYPWVSEGVQHTIRLEQVRLWPSRLEGQIDALAGTDGELPITFFDPLFTANRAFYKKGEIYQFILAGFPYKFEIVDPEPIVIKDPEEIGRLRTAIHQDDPARRDSLEPIVIKTKGMAAFLPREDLAPDDYEFQGPVKSVTEFHTEMLGQQAWRVRITVSRLADKDFDIDLCLTRKVLGDSRLPEIGEDVCGIMWLQGYL
ncbi:MAG: hypothetical protein ABFD97_20185, partial [Syntrophobacter sp.]